MNRIKSTDWCVECLLALNLSVPVFRLGTLRCKDRRWNIKGSQPLEVPLPSPEPWSRAVVVGLWLKGTCLSILKIRTVPADFYRKLCLLSWGLKSKTCHFFRHDSLVAWENDSVLLAHFGSTKQLRHLWPIFGFCKKNCNFLCFEKRWGHAYLTDGMLAKPKMQLCGVDLHDATWRSTGKTQVKWNSACGTFLNNNLRLGRSCCHVSLKRGPLGPKQGPFFAVSVPKDLQTTGC